MCCLCVQLIACLQDDIVVERLRHKSLVEYERFLRKFQYRNALDAAMKVQCYSGVFCVMLTCTL